MIKNQEQKALKTLWYEIWMFNSLVKILVEYLTNPPNTERQQIDENAYLEAFLIHTRNIVDFIENEKYENDLKCSDFAFSKQIVNLPDGNSKEQINYWLSHITKHRLNQTKPNWELKKIQKEINKCFKNFLESIPADSKNELDFSFIE